jgi:hypothetical protein
VDSPESQPEKEEANGHIRLLPDIISPRLINLPDMRDVGAFHDGIYAHTITINDHF